MTAVIAAVGLIAAVIWEYHQEHPVLDVRLFLNRNFSVACIMMFMLGASLYGATVLIPQLVQTLMGYTAQQAGMVLSPGAVLIILFMPVVGKLVNKVDARWMIFLAFGTLALSLYHMSIWNLEVDFKTIMMFRIYQCLGLAFLWVPISVMCFQGVPPEKNNNVSGMTNLARNLGGSLGISALSVILARRSQYHQSVLSAHTSQFDPMFQQRISALAQNFHAMGTDMVRATQMAQQVIYGTLQRQAAMLGYLDAIMIFAILCAVIAPTAFLMKRAPRAKPPEGIH
jgi:DHA2 family multidrug resistance protein